MKKDEENKKCSFHSTEMNNQEENIKLDDLTENELGEWEVLFRLESVEDLEKIFSSSKKVDENIRSSK